MNTNLIDRLKRARRKSKGFTLVELLIVIIIIGILAGTMMLTAGSGTDKANATKIVSNLRTLKSAALMYYADNNAWPTPGDDGLKAILKYTDKNNEGLVGANADYVLANKNISDTSTVTITPTPTPTTVSGLFIGYKGSLLTTEVKGKLALMASDCGLWGGTTTEPGNSTFTADDGAVWMRIK